MKRIIVAAAAACLGLAGLAACGSGNGGGSDAAGVYFLNFKPEVADVYRQIAAEYTKETGVSVRVETAASGTYEQTFRSEIAKSDAPTIFQVNGPVGYQNAKAYTADLSGSDLYAHLSDQSLAIHDGDGVYGVAYVIEGCGIIYNDAIMKEYFALPDKAATVGSVEEITDFATLKKVVEDMTKHKDKLGIEGVFSSTSLQTGEDWRWQTHLANVPFYYEFKDDGALDKTEVPSEVKFSYNEDFKKLFDLYLNNSTTPKEQLGAKTVDDSMSEFALGQSAMVQNGNWGWGQINGVQGNTVKAEDVKFLPLYIGVSGEEGQGICIGTENYLAINVNASEAKQKASLDFLWWLYSSDKGKQFVTNDLGFIAPFDTFTAADAPADPLAQDIMAWRDKEGITNLPWVFQLFPSQNFKNQFGDALLQYAQGSANWDAVVRTVVDGWQQEAANMGQG